MLFMDTLDSGEDCACGVGFSTGNVVSPRVSSVRVVNLDVCVSESEDCLRELLNTELLPPCSVITDVDMRG